ncbi:MAG: DUF1295 domain-containing protein [Candidatus Dependentiae bacterium]|jgi:steroid 5-alpha reductase family enzyme
MAEYWVSLFLVGSFVATLVYYLARKIRLMALVDLIWTAGLGIASILFFVSAGLGSARACVVLLLIGLWSFRLSFYLLKDRVWSGHEDPRYKALADYWGDNALRNFYFLFLIQIPFIALFLYPVSVAMQNTAGGWMWSDSLGVIIAVIAMCGEAVADRQLSKFRADPRKKGGVCRSGLWRYSRHPNYFFEWLHWFAYVAFAYTAPNGWLALLGPLSMYIFLRFLTGVPPAERSSLKSRGEAYREYQKTTNAFFPWIPRDQAV